MSHENITFNDIYNQANFLDSLQYIPHAMLGNEIPFSNIADITAFYNTHGLTALPPSNVPLQISANNAGELPLSVATLLDGYLASFSLPAIPGPTGPSYSFTNLADLLSGGNYLGVGLYDGLLLDFAAALNFQVDSIPNVSGGDWQILTEPPSASPPISFGVFNSNNPFTGAVNHFLSQFQYPQSPLTGNLPYYKYFLDQWHQYLSGVALLVNPQPSDPAVFQELVSYEAIYKAYAKDTSTAAFKTRLNQFYQDQMNSKGYFMPSQILSEWVTAIRNENGIDINMELIGSSLAGNSSEKALVLNRIIRLLISIIKTLQDVGITQANRLTYLTKYQNVYTALQTQIPVFLKDGSTPLGLSSTNAGQARNELNSSFNGILTDNLRSLRGIQEDNAKKLQSNVNQTNDAVNQQTDMASTFIQQLSTLLSTILR